MESMTGAPHYMYIREPLTYTHMQFLDSILFDGFTEMTEK